MSIAEKLTQIAENQQKVYDAGKKAQYDAFWNAYQMNGERRGYEFGFSGAGWTDETFVPKYDIIATGNAHNMFTSSRMVDLSAALKKAGVSLNIGAADRVDTMFYYSTLLTNVPKLDVRGVTYIGGLNNMFASCVKLQTIEKLILPTDRYISANSSAFSNCKALKNIVIEGKIGTSGWSFKSCTLLTAGSLTSIINALAEDVSGLSVTLPLAAVKREFETAEGANNGNTSARWLALAGTKSNWTITLS